MKRPSNIVPDVPSAEPASDPRVRLAGLVLALVTVLVYLPVCFHDFIDFDDPSYVLENGMVQGGLTWAGLKWAFVGWHAGNWHPLTWLSHMLDCQLFGLNAGAHHFINVLFHAANAVLLFRLCLRLTGAFWPAAFVAALFAWHPLHVESVAWISERKDVLSTFFGLLSLLAYVRHVKAKPPAGKSRATSRFLYLSLFFFALSLLAKPMLVTLPCLLLLLDYWPLKRDKFQILEKWPFFLLTFISCLLTYGAQRGQAVISLQQFSLGLRLENAVMACFGYLCRLIWPVNLGIFYPLPDHFSPFAVVLAAAVLVGITLLVWWRRNRGGYFFTGWFWFLGMLVPVIGLVQVGNQAMADRYTYLPSVGLFLLVAFGFSGLAARWKLPDALTGIAGGLILAGCIAVTEHQLTFWRDSQTLFIRTLAVTSDNGPAHMMLGVAYEKQERPADALKEYQAALHSNASLMLLVTGGGKRPLAAQVKLLLGQAAEKNGDSTAALGDYQAALQLDPDLVEAHNNLGNLLDGLGRTEAALAEYQAAVQLRPELPQMHENVGSQLAKMGRLDDALREYTAAAALAPGDPRPFYLMGKACLRAGQGGVAITKFQAALQLDPDDYQSLGWLARILAAADDPQIRNGAQAVALAEKANHLTEAKQPFILATLAMAYAEAGRFDDAQQAVKTAIPFATAAGEDVSSLQAQLRTYAAGQPWREIFTNAPPSSTR